MERNEINGWLNINKPYGFSSAKVVAIIKRILKAKKVGHGGTLDPLAVGVLPICINKATKIMSFLEHESKEYIATIRFGSFTEAIRKAGMTRTAVPISSTPTIRADGAITL